MGQAKIAETGCLLSEQQECDRCKTYCPYDAISIQASEVDFDAWPVVDRERCVGCGACVVACPVGIVEVVKGDAANT